MWFALIAGSEPIGYKKIGKNKNNKKQNKNKNTNSKMRTENEQQKTSIFQISTFEPSSLSYLNPIVNK
jgi:hypothetical protein